MENELAQLWKGLWTLLGIHVLTFGWLIKVSMNLVKLEVIVDKT